MQTSRLFALAFVAALTLSAGAASAANVLKRPLSNPLAADTTRCSGAACSVVSRVGTELRASADGTGAPQGPSAETLEEAQRLVAYLNWKARLEAWSAATGNGFTSASTADSLTAIGGYDQLTWGILVTNLRTTASLPVAPAVCAAAATLGATCGGENGYTVTVAFNAGTVVFAYTPDTLTDTAQALFPGAAPAY